MTLTVTLDQIRAHRPCAKRWTKALRHLDKTDADDTAVSFRDILDVMGLADAIWCLRALPNEYAGSIRLMACDFAESVLHLVPKGEDRPRQAIDVARRYARGEATYIELGCAQSASQNAKWEAWDAAWAARGARGAPWGAAWAAARAAAGAAAWDAWAAAWDAARSAHAAAWASHAAVGVAEREKQKQIFLKWLEQFEVDLPNVSDD